jgi:hypothetical protein
MPRRINVETLGSWTIFTEVNDRGRFDRHGAAIDYDDGPTLSFSIWFDSTVTMRIFKRRWQLRTGSDFSVDYTTHDDLGDRVGNLYGNAIEENKIQFDIDFVGQAFLAEIRRARSIDIVVKDINDDEIGNWEDLDMTGSAAALQKVAARARETADAGEINDNRFTTGANALDGS